MFHCNGWTLTWAVTAAGGTHVCVDAVRPNDVWQLLAEGGVTHFSGAPTVLQMLMDAEDATALARRVKASVGGAPPSPNQLARLHDLGVDVTHLYGLTETYGPAVVNVWQDRWDGLNEEERAAIASRQGVSNILASTIEVVDDDWKTVPSDGVSIGEIVICGNNVASGYLDRRSGDTVAFDRPAFRTGDMAVVHPDGYLEIRDRVKDVIISGGENVSSLEVERQLVSHPQVVAAAVVGRDDAYWGQRVVAFVELRAGATVTELELAEHVRSGLAGFKVPREMYFGSLPVNSTGKVPKHELRRRLTDGSVTKDASSERP